VTAAILQLFCRTRTQKEHTLLLFHIMCVQSYDMAENTGQPSVRWFAGKLACRRIHTYTQLLPTAHAPQR